MKTKRHNRLGRLHTSRPIGVCANPKNLAAVPDQLLVPCWCEAAFAYVSKDDVKAGTTFSCGLPACYRGGYQINGRAAS